MPSTTVSDAELLDGFERFLLGTDEPIVFGRFNFKDGKGVRSHAIGVTGVHGTYGTLREMMAELMTRRTRERLV